VIIMTAYGTIDLAVETLKQGAYDFVTKPLDHPRLFHAIDNCLVHQRLLQKAAALEQKLQECQELAQFIGSSPALKKALDTIAQVAKLNVTVLLRGESGTGKELAARAIHVLSTRREQAFVSVNCGALPETLLESELFGHLKGSFTGATTNHKGLFEVAHNGTILLDEIAEMTPSMQVKLLRVLQEKKIRRIGAGEEIEVDVRIIAATNKNLEEMVEERTFREDLYYRLAVIPIHMVPLRERREDIPMLAEHFLAKANQSMNKQVAKISDEAMELLSKCDWPGNVRELENVIERAVALEPSRIILPERLPDKLRESNGDMDSGMGGPSLDELPEEGIDFHEHMDSIQKRLLSMALARAGGVQTRAAKFLRMNLRSFRYLLQKYDLR
jgi:two-component system, NtrC family, response regulator PilR